MFEWSTADDEREGGRWMAAHHPFTSVHDEDLDKLTSDPARCRSKAYDLVLNGIELGSGSIRIHRRDVQTKVFAALASPRKRRGGGSDFCWTPSSMARPRMVASRWASTAL